MSDLDNCPHCSASLIGDDIPLNIREHYSPPYKWRREIGVEYTEMHDGVWEWQCPDCAYTWPSEANKIRKLS